MSDDHAGYICDECWAAAPDWYLGDGAYVCQWCYDAMERDVDHYHPRGPLVVHEMVHEQVRNDPDRTGHSDGMARRTRRGTDGA